jgi:hypothetical protein
MYISMSDSLIWSKLTVSKMRLLYRSNAFRDLISETLNIRIRNSTNNYFPRYHTKHCLVIYCIVYNTTYSSYLNINTCSISHKSNHCAVWLVACTRRVRKPNVQRVINVTTLQHNINVTTLQHNINITTLQHNIKCVRDACCSMSLSLSHLLFSQPQSTASKFITLIQNILISNFK